MKLKKWLISINWRMILDSHVYLNKLVSKQIVIVVQLLSCVWLFVTTWAAACQASLSSTIYWSLLKFKSIELVMPSNHLILCHPLFSLSSIFLSIRVFSSESVLCIRWPKYWSFSFSISPSNEYSNWFPLVWPSGSPRDSQESFPAPQFKSINFSVLSLLSHGPAFTSIRDYWKNHRFDCTDLCWQIK